ncbi:hypothetical protein [Aquihabitans sp. McL0605]|uniref:hypothetical protein n=1 Tax=Aquihabitans sp. McL0605 TaxID=3415671 RepID=UPI003CEEFB18
MKRRTGLTLAAAATLAASGLVPGGIHPASADTPEADPGANQPDNGIVPADVTADLESQNEQPGHYVLEAPPSHAEMIAAAGASTDLIATGGPVLIHGTVTGPSGGSGGGELLVYLADESAGADGTVSMSPIARAVLTSSGTYSINPQVTARMVAQMIGQGNVNLMIAGTFQGKAFTTSLVRTYHQDPGNWTTTTDATNPAVDLVASIATAPLSAAQQAARASAAPAAAPSMGGCSSHTVSSYQVSSIVGEVHDSSLFNGEFAYSNASDTELGTEVSLSGGPWKVDGAYKVSHTNAAANSFPLHTDEHLFVYGNFQYHDELHECTDGYSYSYWTTALPYGWNGGIRRGRSTSVKYCGGNDWTYRQTVEAGGEFKRSSNKAQTWVGGLSVHGIGLRARSGFSSAVSQKWKTGKAASFVCGNGNSPTKSTRVFTSNTQA